MKFLKSLFGNQNSVQQDDADHPDRKPGQRDDPVELPMESGRVIATGVASIILYDLANLKHRLDDTCDWFAVPQCELEELTDRNLLIFNLGGDGVYEVKLEVGKTDPDKRFSVNFTSGEVYLGAGETITREDCEPDGLAHGFFTRMSPGDYAVSARRSGSQITLTIEESEAFANSSESRLTLFANK